MVPRHVVDRLSRVAIVGFGDISLCYLRRLQEQGFSDADLLIVDANPAKREQSHRMYPHIEVADHLSAVWKRNARSVLISADTLDPKAARGKAAELGIPYQLVQRSVFSGDFSLGECVLLEEPFLQGSLFSFPDATLVEVV